MRCIFEIPYTLAYKSTRVLVEFKFLEANLGNCLYSTVNVDPRTSIKNVTKMTEISLVYTVLILVSATIESTWKIQCTFENSCIKQKWQLCFKLEFMIVLQRLLKNMCEAFSIVFYFSNKVSV